MKILLYQIYGTQSVYHLELTYSVLSAARFLKDDPDDIRICLLAGPGNERPDLPVENIPVSDETLNRWQMGGSYNHAIQALGLKDALDQFKAPVVLIDSDTVFHKHPKHIFDRIGPGRTVMHTRESTLRDGFEWAEWDRIIRQTQGTLAGIDITPESVMYNAGVLGVHPQDIGAVDDAIAVMQSVRDISTVFTAVQLATSLAFAARTDLSVCDDVVEHYWAGPRAFYQYQMKQMFNGPTGAERDPKQDAALAPLSTQLTGKLSHRLIARMKSLRSGGDPRYVYAVTAYLSALDRCDDDPDLANVWATTALNILQWGLGDNTAQVRLKDFEHFTPERIGRQGWMQPSLQQKWTDYCRKVEDSRLSKSAQ
mgnify:CR=1 FL=1